MFADIKLRPKRGVCGQRGGPGEWSQNHQEGGRKTGKKGRELTSEDVRWFYLLYVCFVCGVGGELYVDLGE